MFNVGDIVTLGPTKSYHEGRIAYVVAFKYGGFVVELLSMDDLRTHVRSADPRRRIWFSEQELSMAIKHGMMLLQDIDNV
jgi:hypothetical protein